MVSVTPAGTFRVDVSVTSAFCARVTVPPDPVLFRPLWSALWVSVNPGEVTGRAIAAAG